MKRPSKLASILVQGPRMAKFKQCFVPYIKASQPTITNLFDFLNYPSFRIPYAYICLT
jgi:hypothetical protein